MKENETKFLNQGGKSTSSSLCHVYTSIGTSHYRTRQVDPESIRSYAQVHIAFTVNDIQAYRIKCSVIVNLDGVGSCNIFTVWKLKQRNSTN